MSKLDQRLWLVIVVGAVLFTALVVWLVAENMR